MTYSDVGGLFVRWLVSCLDESLRSNDYSNQWTGYGAEPRVERSETIG